MRVIINKDPYIKGSVKDLIEPPVIIRVGEITEFAAKEFSKQMTEAYNTGQDVIPVVIDSFGGDAYALLSMLSDIESSKLPVVTICIGKAMSAGAILLAHGIPGGRFIDPTATVMIHEVSSSNWWAKLSDLKVDVAEISRLNCILFTKMAYACGHKDRNFFLKLIEKKHNIDLYVNAFEAQKLKIIDHLGIPEFRVTISSKIEFCFDKPKIRKK
jgi:ATP-dependent Clp endopeptidase proteolytic subunit ClpP